MARQNQRRGRSAGDVSPAGPAISPADPIPLNVLRQSSAQNSSAESSNLSSSQSPSTTPPSSAEQLPRQETWPSLASDSTARPTSPSPQPPQSQPSTGVREETDAPQTQPHQPGNNGNQATQVQQQQDYGDAQEVPRSRFRIWNSGRSWFRSSIGITSLIVTMVSVFFYGIRSYQIARWSERNDFLEMCATVIQANASGGPHCKTALDEGPTLPPYSKRAVLYSPGVGAYKLTKRATSAFLNVIPATKYGFGLFETGVLAVFLAFVVAWGILAVLCSRTIKEWVFRSGGNQSMEELVFTSPVRSEGTVKVTRHRPEGSETVEPEGPVQITKRKPPEDYGIGEVRRRVLRGQLRRADSGADIEEGLLGKANLNSSDDTLVAAWSESSSKKVSIATSSNEGLHDGLIELKPSGSTKNFLDPDTGASYHLSPWKSTHSDDEDEEPYLHTKPNEVGAVKHAIVKMSVGSAALANGKAIEDQVGDALQTKERIPQQTGDCLAGEVTNEVS